MTMSGYSPSGGNVGDWMAPAHVSMVLRIAAADGGEFLPPLSAMGRRNGVTVRRFTIVLPIETPGLTVNKRWAARVWFTSLLRRNDLLFLNDNASSVMQISSKQRAWALLFVCRTQLRHWGWFVHGSGFQAASQHTLESTFRRTYSMGLSQRNSFSWEVPRLFLPSALLLRPMDRRRSRILSALRGSWCSPGTRWLLHPCCTCITWSSLAFGFKIYQL